MCLLVALKGVVPGLPLVVAANRDEFLARPAVAMTVLRDAGPRILGGRDELAGGTWLAVNEHGVFAGLTNFASPVRDASKKSRGELPLALARHTDARGAVDAFCRDYRPADYNAAWILVGDRHDLYYIDFTRGDLPFARALPTGIHVLENRPLEPPSAKASAVAAAAGRLDGDPVEGLTKILASHTVPDGIPEDSGRPRAIEAPCVHAGPYGTRWSAAIAIVTYGPPRIQYADGPPCMAEFANASGLWNVV